MKKEQRLMTRGEIDALIAEIIISQEELTLQLIEFDSVRHSNAEVQNVLLFA